MQTWNSELCEQKPGFLEKTYRQCTQNAYKTILTQKLYIPYLIDVLPVSYNTKVQFNEVPLNSVCLQGDRVVPGTLSLL